MAAACTAAMTSAAQKGLADETQRSQVGHVPADVIVDVAR